MIDGMSDGQHSISVIQPIGVSARELVEFFRDMGKRPEGVTPDRRDGNRGYSPANCRWNDKEEQALNRRGSKNKEPTSERNETMQFP